MTELNLSALRELVEWLETLPDTPAQGQVFPPSTIGPVAWDLDDGCEPVVWLAPERPAE